MRPRYRFVQAMTLRLRPWIPFGCGARPRRARREIFGEDQSRLAFRSQSAKQTAEGSEIHPTRGIGQGFLAQTANPPEQMRIAAQLREAVHIGEIGLEIG